MARAGVYVGIVLLSAGIAGAAEAGEQMTFKACGEKYRAAKADGSLGERKWTEFREAVCGIKPAQKAIRSASPVMPASEAAGAEILRRVAFPATLSGEFSGQTPSQQRMRTCLKSYHANKDAGTLSGLRWVQKGGGYYSLCSARLKAAGA